MPIYEYECTACGERLEVMQRFDDPPVATCRSCEAPVRKIISPSGFVLKGGGWYVTDYPSEARKKGLEAEKKAGGKSKSAKSGKTEKKEPSTSKSAKKSD